MRINSQTTMVIELEDGLTKRLEVESNLLCAAGTGRLPEQYACSIGGTMEDFASLALKSRGTL
jgi:activator of 2-hydroxyglutaryl-CoA dehydratase